MSAAQAEHGWVSRFFAAHGKFVVLFLIGLSGLVIDLATKHWAFSHPVLARGGTVRLVEGWLELRLAENQGVAFSLLWGHQGLQVAFGGVAFLVILYFVHVARGRFEPAVLGLVLAGTAGNFLDRCLHVGRSGHTAVRDFVIARTPGGAEWPAFNAADVFVVVGALCLFALAVRQREAAPAEASA